MVQAREGHITWANTRESPETPCAKTRCPPAALQEKGKGVRRRGATRKSWGADLGQGAWAGGADRPGCRTGRPAPPEAWVHARGYVAPPTYLRWHVRFTRRSRLLPLGRRGRSRRRRRGWGKMTGRGKAGRHRCPKSRFSAKKKNGREE